MPAFLTEAPEHIILLFRCWFGMSTSTACFSNPWEPIVNLSLGEALGAFALVFAVYQLRSPKWKIILNIRPWWQRNLIWVFSLLGLACVVAAFLQGQVPYYAAWSPGIFELLGFIFLVSAPMSMFLLGPRSRNLFKPSTAARFYEELVMAIASGKTEYTEAVIEILAGNMVSLTTWSARVSELGPTAPDTAERHTISYACASLDVILSDKTVAEHVATKRVDFVSYLFFQLKAKEVPLKAVPHAIEALSRELLHNKNSHLYRQLDRMGTWLSSNLYQQIFRDTTVFTEYQPLHGWLIFHRNPTLLLDEANLEVFLEALEYACEGYWENPMSPSAFRGAFKRLEEHFTQLTFFAYKGKAEAEQSITALSKLSFFLRHTFPWSYVKAYKENKLPQREKEVRMDDEGHPDSLIGYFLQCVVDHFEYLASLPAEFEEDIRLSVMDMLGPFSRVHSEAENNSGVILGKFMDLCWPKIKENIEFGHFPSITRILFIFFSYSSGSGSPFSKQRDAFIDYMQTHLVPKLSEMMANDKDTKGQALLPKQVHYDEKTKNFLWINGKGAPIAMKKSTEQT